MPGLWTFQIIILPFLSDDRLKTYMNMNYVLKNTGLLEHWQYLIILLVHFLHCWFFETIPAADHRVRLNGNTTIYTQLFIAL